MSEQSGAMFDRFTDRARKVMSLARQEAQRCKHDHIGTEHILLGLVQEGSGGAAQALADLDVSLMKVRAEIEKLPAGPRAMYLEHLLFTPRAKSACHLAQKEADERGHPFIGTEHILLGLLREGEGVASQVLMNLGLRLQDVRDAVLNVLRHAPTGTTAASADTAAPRARGGAQSGAMTLDELVVALSRVHAARFPEGPPTLHRIMPSLLEALRAETKNAHQPGCDQVAPEHLLAALLQRAPPPLRMSVEVWERLRQARSDAMRRSHARIGLPHLVEAFLPDAADAVRESKSSAASTAGGEPRFDALAGDAITRACELAWAMGDERMASRHFELALISMIQTEWADDRGEVATELARRRRDAWERVYAQASAMPAARGQAHTLSDAAVSALKRASETARAEGSPLIEPHHLLLALLEDEGGAASRLLNAVRVDRDASRVVADRRPRRVNVNPPESVRLSSATVDAVAMAAEEAFALRREAIDGDHLLLGLLRMPSALAAQALGCVGMVLPRARIAALDLALAR